MKIGLILGDQLSPGLATLAQLDRQRDCLLLAEVGAEARYVAHHQQKIAFIFSAMRHFAAERRGEGWNVIYQHYDPATPERTLLDVVQDTLKHNPADSLVITHCGEYRLQHDIDQLWPRVLPCAVRVLDDNRFLASLEEFKHWAGQRKQLRMEYFYREMRKRTGLLMRSATQPEGGQWNFDQRNRQPYRGEPPIPPLPAFTRDDIDKSVLECVASHFSDHPGKLQPFNWATTGQQARAALDHFIEFRLPWYGDFQDAMLMHEHALFHSLLSPYLNAGLLEPLQVCEAAQTAYQEGRAPLNAVEGFIRQIIGWREYVRGIYWLNMPDYAHLNSQHNQRPLPHYYWSGETRMQCMAQCFKNTFEHGYAHHIQRLMITGNFALLAGIVPREICQWYLAVYVDAYDWVELPNTLGMVMHADGGYLGSKPYAASGNYIHKMSDYCQHCDYNVKTASEADSCPFNSLYWHFMQRHRTAFEGNPRMNMIYRTFDKMDAEKRARSLQHAEQLLQGLDEL